MQFTRRQLISSGKPLLAALLIVWLLMLNALAAAPALHQAIHHDADSGEHQCAVTLFAHGQVDAVDCDVAPSDLPGSVEFAPAAIVSIFSPVTQHLPAGRAPPVSASFLA